MTATGDEQTPLSTLKFMAAIDAVIPDGVVNIVTGFGPEAGEPLTSHPDVRKLAFTGSTAVGKQVMKHASEHVTDIQQAHHTARDLEAGTIWINQYNDFLPGMPFGGYKQSGIGRERARDVGSVHPDEKYRPIASMMDHGVTRTRTDRARSRAYRG